MKNLNLITSIYLSQLAIMNDIPNYEHRKIKPKQTKERINQNEMEKMRRAGKKEFIIENKIIIARSRKEAFKIYKKQS